MNCLEAISLTKTLPCLAEPGKIIVIGQPDRSLDEVIPYLATLPGVIAYNPETLTLTFRRQPGFLTLYPDKVCITQVKDAEAGLEVMDALKDAINVTWTCIPCSHKQTVSDAARPPAWRLQSY